MQSVFAAIGDPTRRHVIELLAARDMPAGEIAEHFAMSRPAVSQHLKVLRDAGLVRVRKHGREQVYRLHAAPLHAVYDWAAHYERFWRRKLDALGTFLEQ